VSDYSAYAQHLEPRDRVAFECLFKDVRRGSASRGRTFFARRFQPLEPPPFIPSVISWLELYFVSGWTDRRNEKLAQTVAAELASRHAAAGAAPARRA